MSKPSNKHPLYLPLDFAVVRAPLLPVEAYLALQSEDDQLNLLKDQRALRALAPASPSLLSALSRWQRGSMTKKDADRLASKLLMYQIRMSTRPTPFGLFAGCATVNWAEHTDLYLRSSFGKTHTRPDFAWLMELVLEAEAIPEVRRQLCYTSNPLIRIQGDRVVLSEATPPANSDLPVSLRATAVVKLAINLAKDGIEAVDLVARIAESSPAATSEKIERLFTQLWEQRILLSDLRPPLTTAGPANYVLDKLANIPQAADVRDKLSLLVNAAAAWDIAPHDQSLNAFRALLESAGCPEDGSKELPIQVDMALCVSGHAGRAIGRRAALAAEMLLRLSPTPRGLSHLTAFRSAFVARYGHEREVPLPELIDPVSGLGPLSAHGMAPVGPDFNKAALRSRELLQLACSALHKRERVVRLDEVLLERLETWTPDSSSPPLSLDLNLLIAAESSAAIDADEFDLVIGPNLGAWSAGRTFGRFAHLHPSGRDLLEQALREEEANSEPDHIWAEVVYLPRKVRAANVAVRPPLRTYEVAFGISAGVAREFVLHPDDLVVGVENNRFYVRWLPRDKRVKFASGHMLNHLGAPAMAQFLLQVGYDGQTPLTSFDWGPAEGFPFLPRVQVDRIVLRPAEWRLFKSASVQQDSEALKRWCGEWDVPRSVCLTFADNRLILNLDLVDHARILLWEWKRLPDNQSLLLQEVLPSLDEAWLRGDEGRYYSEFTVPLLLQQEAATIQKSTASKPRPVATPVWEFRREFQPGSEWLFIKLYGSSDRQDELITQLLLPFARNALAAGLIDSWFFIRYADPEEHLRVRFHGDPERLCEQFFGQVCRWASELVGRGLCRRFGFDLYDSELERFGGPEGVSLSEEIFHADSEASSELTTVLAAKEWLDPEQRTLLLVLSVHDLIGGFGLDESGALDWYKRHSVDSKELGEEYRKLKHQLRVALSDPTNWLAARPLGDQVNAALLLRRRQLSPLLVQLQDLEASSTLRRPIDELCASYVHLNLNRLGATASEGKILNFLRRTCESLSKAPVKL
jgi:thiopeptide-type bacteriocin biosynthesis protein